MSSSDFGMGQGSLRGTDSNSLLRLYDRARDLAQASLSQQERVKAEKARERFARELQRRKIRV